MSPTLKFRPLTAIRLAALTIMVLAIGLMPGPTLLAQEEEGCDERCMEEKVSFCDDGDMCSYSGCFETTPGPSCRYVCVPTPKCVF